MLFVLEIRNKLTLRGLKGPLQEVELKRILLNVSWKQRYSGDQAKDNAL